MHAIKGSLRWRILIPLLFVIIFEGILIYIILFTSGPMHDLKENAFDIFQEKLENTKATLENQMVNKWGNIDSDGTAMENTIIEYLQKNDAKPEQLVPGSKLSEEVLGDLAMDLFSVLQKNTITGAFVILDGNGGSKKSGLYFRDSNPYATVGNNSDVLAVRGPSEITNETEIALSSLWLPSFNMEQESDFYYKPFLAAKEYADLETSDLGYWSAPFHLEGNQEQDSDEIITYSIPLRIDGEPVGVMGIELNRTYWKKFLSANGQESEDHVGYAMIKRNSGGKNIAMDPYEMLFPGRLLQRIAGDSLTLEEEGNLADKSFYRVKSDTEKDYYACVKTIKVYNAYTPFANEQWALIGVAEGTYFLDFFQNFTRLLIYSILANVLIGLLVAWVVAKAVSHPITQLTKKLKQAKNMGKVYLEPIHIAEIDELTSTIQSLSDEVMENASKMETILKLADVGIGACEYKKSTPELVFCTGEFCTILNIPWNQEDGNFVPYQKIKRGIFKLRKCLVEKDPSQGIYTLEIPDGANKRWVRIQLIADQEHTLAVATDITRDMWEKKKIEYDRDFDSLTQLYNRRAFHRKMQEIFRDPSTIGTASVVMIDLDNLKYVNDTYGHDYGDEYIGKAASVLRHYRSSQSVVARLSGDEFLLFFYGVKSKDEIRAIMDRVFEEFKETVVELPDGTSVPVRASAGISWYPDDGKDYQDLVKYADFAMYKVKKTNKGKKVEFSFESYNREAYLLQCQEELNLILDKELVEYAFQPIVDMKSGEVFAYEALMRPQTENIKTPLELLSLAKSQSKLQQIERLTMFKSLEDFSKLEIAKTEVKLFINSISNQRLTEEELLDFEKRYENYLPRVVVEFTEAEQIEIEYLEMKLASIRKWNAQSALDDFGEGYNNDGVLLKLDPDFVKIDMSLINNIHTDVKKQSLLQNILRYTTEHGIKVIAEGVECREEMEILVDLGIDYLQGYYLGRPSFQPSGLSKEVKREILAIRKDAGKTGL